MGHVIDLLPTCTDLAGVSYPAQHAGNDVTSVAGRSLRPVLTGGNLPRPEGLFFEHQGNAAGRDGKWKLVRARGAPWSLYDLAADRTELNDLASANPDRVAAMKAKWQDWAKRVGVQPWPLKRRQGE